MTKDNERNAYSGIEVLLIVFCVTGILGIVLSSTCGNS